MRVQVKMPKLADATDTVAVVSIGAAVGERVAVGQELLIVETDKSTVEVPSPVAGRIAEILVKPGQEVATGAPIVTMET